MRNSKGQFVKGTASHLWLPVGSIRIRVRHKRGGEQRAFIKVADPNTWTLLARHVFELENGPIPRGMGIHHKDGNKLNDRLDNFELVNKAEHLDKHRAEYIPKYLPKLHEQRRAKRWSTRAKNRPDGWRRSYSDESFNAAVAAYRNGEGTQTEIEQRFGLPIRTLSARGIKR